MGDEIDMDKAAIAAGKKQGMDKEAKDKMLFDKTPQKEASQKGMQKNKVGNLSEDLFGK